MPFLSTERLSGLIAGAFLIRATESFISAVGALFLPTVDMEIKMSGAVPGLIVAAVAGVLGYGYLLPDRKRGFHIVALVVCALTACGSVLSAIVPFFMHSPASMDSMRTSMFIGAVIRLFVSLALLTGVVAVMKRTARPVPTSA